jgi:catechol 2,3-dioxygenase-like lactoylglutathione lyase family enzyme
MRLGKQEIELVAFAPAGSLYPQARSAADPWFQHFAIVTADMDAAFDALSKVPGWTPISAHGPQLLPPEKGSIIAFKFRDPDGHPLELSYFPPDAAGAWRNVNPGAMFLGIDHSALAVPSIDSSREFYERRLGMKLAGRQLNSGPTQAALDGLAGAEVEIASLVTRAPGPHLELLAYRKQPGWKQALSKVNDVPATRLIASAEGLEGLLASPGIDIVSQGLIEVPEGGRAVIVRTPDAHLMQLHAAGPSLSQNREAGA